MPGLKKIIEYLLYLFVFLLPWQTIYLFQERFINGVKWEYGSLGIYLTEILFWIIVVLFCLNRLIEKKQGKPAKYYFWLVSLLIFVCLSGFSIFWANDKTLALFYFFRLAEGIILFLLILEADSIRSLSWVLVFSGAIQALLAMEQFLNQKATASKWLGMAGQLPGDLGASVVQYVSDGRGYRWLRAYGSFPHPNILGGFLAICFLAGLILYFRLELGWKKIFLTFCLLITAVGLFFSFSRSAWLSIAIGLVLIILTVKKTKKYFPKTSFSSAKIILYLFLLLVPLGIVYQPLVSGRIMLSDNLEKQSLDRRQGLAGEAKEIMRNNRLLGVGMGNYTDYLNRQFKDLRLWQRQPTHNIFFLALAELGAVGLAVFILFLLFFVFSLRREKNWLGLSLLSPLLVIGCLDHYFWTLYPGMMMFWLALAAILKINSEKP